VPTLSRHPRFPPSKHPDQHTPEIPSYLFPPGGTKKAPTLPQDAFVGPEGMSIGCPQAGYLGIKSGDIPAFPRMCLNTSTCPGYFRADLSPARVFLGRREGHFRRPRLRIGQLRCWLLGALEDAMIEVIRPLRRLG
jgi:hypothetical protein